MTGGVVLDKPDSIMNKLGVKFSVLAFLYNETAVSLLIFYGSAVSCHCEYDS